MGNCRRQAPGSQLGKHGSHTQIDARFPFPSVVPTRQRPLVNIIPVETHLNSHNAKLLARYIVERMKTFNVTIPELVLIAATRGILGAGLALLISSHLKEPQRQTAGVILTAIGVLSTIPLAFEVLGKSSQNHST